MIALLFVLLALPSAPGCHSSGPSVHCVLAAAVPVTLAKKPALPAKPAREKPTVDRRPKPQKQVIAEQPASKPPTDPADIQKHIDSLVSIGDCTGARTAANLLSGAETADKAFATCVGGVAQPATSFSSAAVDSGGAQRKP